MARADPPRGGQLPDDLASTRRGCVQQHGELSPIEKRMASNQAQCVVCLVAQRPFSGGHTQRPGLASNHTSTQWPFAGLPCFPFEE
jgi:hypothetical protein